jgi:hypothetical protein
MMTKHTQPVVFLLVGIGAGLAAVLTGRLWMTSLALSGGFFFAIALLIAIVISTEPELLRQHPGVHPGSIHFRKHKPVSGRGLAPSSDGES